MNQNSHIPFYEIDLAFDFTNEVANEVFPLLTVYRERDLKEDTWKIAQKIYNEKYSTELPIKYLEYYLP